MADLPFSTVAGAPSPALSGTSVTMSAGHGARFPAAPFFAYAVPSGVIPTLDNAEKVLVTAKATDVFTIVRARGSTTAKSIAIGWHFFQSSHSPPLDFTVGPSLPSVGAGLVRILGGSTTDRVAAVIEGLIVQVYPAAGWSDAGVPHSAINGVIDVPAGANFFPWATTGVVISSSNNGDHVGVFGAAYGNGTAPKWGANFIARDKNIDTGLSAACNLIGVEVNADCFEAASVAIGVDVIGRGTQALDRGIHVRTDTALGAVGNWASGVVVANSDIGLDIQSTTTVGMRSTVAAIHRQLFEDGQAAPNGRLREVIDANLYRWDISTSGEYAATRTPLLVTLGASGGDTLLGASDTVGTAPVIRAGRGDGTAKLAFFGGTMTAKGAVTGSRGANAALASLLTLLAAHGLLTDSSTA